MYILRHFLEIQKLRVFANWFKNGEAAINFVMAPFALFNIKQITDLRALFQPPFHIQPDVAQ